MTQSELMDDQQDLKKITHWLISQRVRDLRF